MTLRRRHRGDHDGRGRGRDPRTPVRRRAARRRTGVGGVARERSDACVRTGDAGRVPCPGQSSRRGRRAVRGDQESSGGRAGRGRQKTRDVWKAYVGLAQRAAARTLDEQPRCRRGATAQPRAARVPRRADAVAAATRPAPPTDIGSGAPGTGASGQEPRRPRPGDPERRRHAGARQDRRHRARGELRGHARKSAAQEFSQHRGEHHDPVVAVGRRARDDHLLPAHAVAAVLHAAGRQPDHRGVPDQSVPADHTPAGRCAGAAQRTRHRLRRRRHRHADGRHRDRARRSSRGRDRVRRDDQPRERLVGAVRDPGRARGAQAAHRCAHGRPRPAADARTVHPRTQRAGQPGADRRVGSGVRLRATTVHQAHRPAGPDCAEQCALGRQHLG
ncbi:hypothetical protein MSMEI_1347 [Mycolicibacterium smegmatis MC2 155]|uniref:Uncharacterized protein n=1 Tax=Mycolicibacterium smegmatis (strain ATCC 700084 / mc(2)155) TaxID=246196 RepID=I7F8A1_MYCS2|nr:hypothetical protein MSMEI_1347 [Mycolicibacterium smegmatis MC2 155]